MKKMVVLWVALLYSIGFSQSYHADYKTVNMHSPFRWVVADSTARVALTVTARDTQKLCFQIADTTIWLLSDDSPKRWTWVTGKKVDSLKITAANITRANIDTSKTRHATVDSATIPVLKGHTTKRDSTTFTGGIRGVRLSMDSIFNLTGTAGYVQYLSSTKKFIDAPIYTNGTNVAIGKSSVENWSSAQKALQVGGTFALFGVATEDNGANYLSTNAYYDVAWKPLIGGGSCMYRQSTNADHLWYSNIGLTSNTAYSPIITMSLSPEGVLNLPSLTASRAVVTDGSKNIVSSSVTSTELGYLSGKNSVIDGSGTAGNIPVFTGTGRIGNGPAYNSGTGTVTGNITGKADTARAAYKADTARAAYKAATASELYPGTWYKDTVISDSLYEGETLISYAGARIIKVGRLVTISFEALGGSLTGGSTLTIKGIPYTPERSIYMPVLILDNNTTYVGVFEYHGSTFAIKTEARLSLSAGIGGLRPQSITFTTN